MTSRTKLIETPASAKLVVSITNRCVKKRCRDCYVDFSNKIDLPAGIIEANVAPYTRRRVEGKKVATTIVGGEPSNHPEYPRVIRAFAEGDGGCVDVITNGTLFARHPEEFFSIVNASKRKFTVVLSYDEHHREAVKKSDKYAFEAFRQFRRQWKNGSKVGFVISNTRFADEEELPVEKRIMGFARDSTSP